MNSSRIQLAVFDLDGTVVDFGALAAATATLEVFAEHRIMLTLREVRLPMGLPGYDYVRTLLEMPAVGAQWQFVHGRRWEELDAMALAADLAAALPEQCGRHCELTPGLVEAAGWLREREIKIGTTTSLDRTAAEVFWDGSWSLGFAPDAQIAADETAAGRPAPWMIFRLMEQLDVFPPAAVVKIGDTPLDVQEGRNAGAWSIGVTSSGNEIGLPPADWQALPDPDRQARHEAAAGRLRGAGAHHVIANLADLAAALEQIDSHLAAGERP